MKRDSMLDLDDDLDLSLDDDELDLDDGIPDLLALDDDDLLELGPEELEEMLYNFTPEDPAEMVEFCRVVYKQYREGSCKDKPYEGVIGQGTCNTIGKVFAFWWKKFNRDGNKTALEVAYMAASRLIAGVQKPDVSSPKWPGQFLEGEVMRADGHGNVFVAIKMPDPHTVRSNIKGGVLKHERIAWFNVASGRPLDASEPFRLI